MRRTDREMSEKEAIELLKKADYGFMGMVDEDGAPYVIPLNFVYADGAIYIHGAYEGQKMDNLTRDERACFSVVGGVEVISERFTTKYQSALVRGRVKMLEDEPKRQALLLLCQKYTPVHMPQAVAEIEKSGSRTCVIRISVDSITGKANRNAPPFPTLPVSSPTI